MKEKLQAKLDSLNSQLKSVEATYLKVQGAIELCEALMIENEKPKETEKKDK